MPDLALNRIGQRYIPNGGLLSLWREATNTWTNFLVLATVERDLSRSVQFMLASDKVIIMDTADNLDDIDNVVSRAVERWDQLVASRADKPNETYVRITATTDD